MTYRNVLHYASYDAPYMGNFMSSLLYLDAKLQENGHKMAFLFSQIAKSRPWVAILQSKDNDLSFMHGDIRQDISTLKNMIADKAIDILHLHFCSAQMIVMANLALLFSKRTKCVIHLHNHYPDHTNIIKDIMRKVLYSGKYYACCSRSVAMDLESKGFERERIFVAENAIDFSRLDHCETNKSIEVAFNRQSFKILVFGFDFERKGLDIAAKAVGRARESTGLDIELFVCVAINLGDVTRKLIDCLGRLPNWIKMLPPRNDIATYYKFVDLFISPSREEGFCYALVEAAYCKTPTAASMIPAQKELELPYCKWFQSGNANELASIIANLATKGGIPDQLLEKQKISVTQRYDLAVWANSLLEMYDRI
ncbi:MAG: glycosyltransferase family 4 protein [Syntrophobacteraceae bacterium]